MHFITRFIEHIILVDLLNTPLPPVRIFGDEHFKDFALFQALSMGFVAIVILKLDFSEFFSLPSLLRFFFLVETFHKTDYDESTFR